MSNNDEKDEEGYSDRLEKKLSAPVLAAIAVKLIAMQEKGEMDRIRESTERLRSYIRKDTST